MTQGGAFKPDVRELGEPAAPGPGPGRAGATWVPPPHSSRLPRLHHRRQNSSIFAATVIKKWHILGLNNSELEETHCFTCCYLSKKNSFCSIFSPKNRLMERKTMA